MSIATMNQSSSLSLNRDVPFGVEKNQSTNSTTDFAKGFFPLMSKLMEPNASFSWQAYKWQVGNQFRQDGLKRCGVSKNIFGFLLSRFLYRTVCTLTAANIFSVFAENTVRGRDEKFCKQYLNYNQYGLATFKEKVNEILATKGEKGMACLCFIGAPWAPVHELVMEITPEGKICLYQSYVGKYSFEESMKTNQPREINEVLEKLEIIGSIESNAITPVQMEAYNNLFHIEAGFRSLNFSFIPIEYDRNDFSKVPRAVHSLTLSQRIVNFWKMIVERISAVFSRIPPPFNRKVVVG